MLQGLQQDPLVAETLDHWVPVQDRTKQACGSTGFGSVHQPHASPVIEGTTPVSAISAVAPDQTQLKRVVWTRCERLRRRAKFRILVLSQTMAMNVTFELVVG